MQGSLPYFLHKNMPKKDIVRYSDRQKKRELAGTVSKQWDTDWEFPSELKLKGAMKTTHVSFALGDASKQLKQLADEDADEDEEADEERDEEAAIEEYEEEEEEEGTDYVNQYFDNGEDDPDDNLDDGEPTF